MANTFGKIFTLTTFGESHGEAIGGIIDGCPAGIELNLETVQKDMDRRKPGQSKIVTQRKEPDEVQFLSGIFGTFWRMGPYRCPLPAPSLWDGDVLLFTDFTPSKFAPSPRGTK